LCPCPNVLNLQHDSHHYMRIVDTSRFLAVRETLRLDASCYA